MPKSMLNPEQKKAATYGNGPLLIIAGAGTGKTTVITERIKYLILKENVLPQNLLALTFTEKAAQEMQERIDIALPYGYSDMWIHTFHGFCDRILRKEAIHIGLTPAYKMLSESQAVLFLRKHLFQLSLSYFLPLGNPDKFLQGLLQHFSRLKDEDISPEDYLKYAKSYSKKTDITAEEKKLTNELAHAYETYEKLKVKEGIVDFSDLIAHTLFLFRKRPHILKKYQKQFTHILVDEFQDTNFSQNQLAILLAGETKNITVVGDDDQAIYRWRGAAISNMMQFRKNFPKAEIVTLTQNYRSTQNILDTAYQVIQNNNPDRLEVQEKIDKRLITGRKIKGKNVDIILEKNGELEAEVVCQKIKEIMKGENLSYKDFAILVRANDNAQPFIRMLDNHNIPHQFLGPEQLFVQEEIKDLIAILKVFYDVHDDQSLYRVLAIPSFGISFTDISQLLKDARKTHSSLFNTIRAIDLSLFSEKGKERMQQIINLFETQKANATKESAGRLLYEFFSKSGMLTDYLQGEKNPRKAENVAKFFDRLKSFEAQNPDASVFSVVDWLDLSMQMGESPLATENDWAANDAVNILTIHGSKGLEFPVVFVINLVTQRFPTRERGEQIPIPDSLIKEILPAGDYHLQEERRLFYVAITRAKDQLFLTAALNYGDGKRERKLSPFLIESVGQALLDEKKKLLDTAAEKSLMPSFPAKAEKRIDMEKPKITYLSYSQIQTFDICPLHYKLRYILKLPTTPSPALSFGTSVHAVLREYYLSALQGEKKDLTDIPLLTKTLWTPDGYESKEHEEQAFRSAVKLTETYLKENFDEKHLPAALEVPFLFSLNGIKIGGRMDRVDEKNDGTIEIVDYKTGRNMLSERELQNNLQLTIYALAATKIHEPLFHKNPKNITLSLHYLETGKIITTTRTKEQLEKAEEELLEKAKTIEQSDFICSKSLFCKDCEYSMFCSQTK